MGIANEYRATSRDFKNILIEDNDFRVFSDQPLLNLFAVDGLTFRNNRLERSTRYPSSAVVETPPFEVTDSDRVSLEAPAPVKARYGWATNPEGCNLYNAAGLPASPFRTQD